MKVYSLLKFKLNNSFVIEMGDRHATKTSKKKNITFLRELNKTLHKEKTFLNRHQNESICKVLNQIKDECTIQRHPLISRLQAIFFPFSTTPTINRLSKRILNNLNKKLDQMDLENTCEAAYAKREKFNERGRIKIAMSSNTYF